MVTFSSEDMNRKLDREYSAMTFFPYIVVKNVHSPIKARSYPGWFDVAAMRKVKGDPPLHIYK
jgi:hypothetical protein